MKEAFFQTDGMWQYINDFVPIYNGCNGFRILRVDEKRKCFFHYEFHSLRILLGE